MTTLGEYRVRITFNPGKDPVVDAIKRAAADLIDLVSDIATTADATGSEVNRLKALAMTCVEEAAMWAVKAATNARD